jgi:hypothetical protein
MATYNVHLVQTVSTVVTVEADSPQDAVGLAWDSEDMPGSMVYGAFGSASVDEARDWEAMSVTDAEGNEVWTGGEW